MTDIQLRYWSLQEDKRHNLTYEGETYRSNKAREAQASRELVETTRSNKARETENYRSNIARETENYRSNVARESENIRSNKTREKETHRANLANESIGRSMASASAIQAQAAQSQAATAQQRQSTYDYLSQKQAGKLQSDTYAQDMSNAVREFNLESEKVTSAISSNVKPISDIVDTIFGVTRVYSKTK